MGTLSFTHGERHIQSGATSTLTSVPAVDNSQWTFRAVDTVDRNLLGYLGGRFHLEQFSRGFR